MKQDLYCEIQTLIDERKLDQAQKKLYDVEDRDAAWYYLCSKVYLAKGWTNQSRIQLEKALELDPENEEYEKELATLKEKAEEERRRIDSESKSKHLGKDFFAECPSGCAEACAACCCEVGCTAICEGCGSC